MFSHRTGTLLAKALVVLAFGAAVHSDLAGSKARADLVNVRRLIELPASSSILIDINMINAAGPINVPYLNMANPMWSVRVEQASFDGGATANDIRVRVQHLVAAHAGENLNPTIVQVTLNNINLAAVANGPAFGSEDHGPHAGHLDRVNVSSFLRPGNPPAVPAGGQELQITIFHRGAPEPGSLILSGMGMFGLLGYARYRRKQAGVGGTEGPAQPQVSL